MWLQLLRAGAGALAALFLGTGLGLSTDGASHESATYLGFYGTGALLVLAAILLSLAIHSRKEVAKEADPKTRPLRWEDLARMRVPVEAEGAKEHRQTARRGARHIHAELEASRKKLDDALAHGYWWNVGLEGLQSGEWQRARDVLADDAPVIYDSVAPLYVLIDDMNAQANNYQQGGHDDFSEETTREMRSLRSRITSTQRALQKYYSAL
ncbi:MAG: hypothetical protein QOF85_1945 [Solirubrobacterales bacterium]|jgi:hypothetical protein|nr:hypothetical protein [Solirubrobacterales bacterium]